MENSSKNLPRRIQCALAKLISYANNTTLPKPGLTAQHVLLQLLRCADAVNPATPIRVRKEVLAIKLDLSKPTIDRSLRALEEGGWIQRLEQVKSRARGFQIGEIQLSTNCLETLFENSVRKPPATQATDQQPDLHPVAYSNHRTTLTSDPSEELEVNSCQPAEIEPVNQNPVCESPMIHAYKNSLVTKVTTSYSLNKRHPASPSCFDRLQESRIEPGLQILLKYFNPKTINWFKGLASANKKRLEDIVVYLGESIHSIKNLKAYLHACIRLETDFKGKLLQREQAVQQEQETKARADQLKKWIESNNGHSLLDTWSGKQVRVDQSHVHWGLNTSQPVKHFFDFIQRNPGRFVTVPSNESLTGQQVPSPVRVSERTHHALQGKLAHKQAAKQSVKEVSKACSEALEQAKRLLRGKSILRNA